MTDLAAAGVTTKAPDEDTHTSWRERLASRLDTSDRQVLALWVASRVSMGIIAMAVGFLITGASSTSFLERWRQWDVQHFWGIATYGYGGQPTGVPNEAFFPGLPSLMWLGHTLTHVSAYTAGLVVSLIAGAVAAVALGRLGDHEYGPGTGRLAVAAWVVAPPAVFLAAAYTESLFLAFAIPAWLAARKGRWALTGTLAAFAMTVRVSGVFLLAALAVEFVTSRRFRSWLDAAWLLLPVGVIAGWMAYLHSESGDWLMWLHAQQQGWYRGFIPPWESLAHTWTAGFSGRYDPGVSLMFRFEIVAVAVGLVGTLWLLWRRRWGEATWIGTQVAAFSTSYWFFSVPRSVLLWFPLWIALAATVRRRPWVGWVYLTIALPLCALWAVTFLTGKWAG